MRRFRHSIWKATPLAASVLKERFKATLKQRQRCLRVESRAREVKVMGEPLASQQVTQVPTKQGSSGNGESLSWSCEERPQHRPCPRSNSSGRPHMSASSVYFPSKSICQGPQWQLVSWTTTTTKLFFVCKVLRLISIRSSRANSTSVPTKFGGVQGFL